MNGRPCHMKQLKSKGLKGEWRLDQSLSSSPSLSCSYCNYSEIHTSLACLVLFTAAFSQCGCQTNLFHLLCGISSEASSWNQWTSYSPRACALFFGLEILTQYKKFWPSHNLRTIGLGFLNSQHVKWSCCAWASWATRCLEILALSAGLLCTMEISHMLKTFAKEQKYSNPQRSMKTTLNPENSSCRWHRRDLCAIG